MKEKGNLYIPSKEALDRHNKKKDIIEKETEKLEETLVDTYIDDLKAEAKGKSVNRQAPKKAAATKRAKAIRLTEEEIKKIKERAKKKAGKKYRKNLFRKRVKKLMPNEGEPKWAVPLGATVTGVVVLLIIISSIIISNSLKFQIPTAEQKEHYEKLVAPAVLFDETGFETIGTAEDNYILMTGIWREYTENKFGLGTNSYGSYVVPFHTAVERSKEVFGNFTKEIEPFNVIYNHITFNWDSEHDYFIIPASGYPSDITPEVTKIKKRKNETILLVNYLTMGEQGEWEVVAEKQITVIKNEDQSEYIYSISENLKND